MRYRRKKIKNLLGGDIIDDNEDQNIESLNNELKKILHIKPSIIPRPKREPQSKPIDTRVLLK